MDAVAGFRNSHVEVKLARLLLQIAIVLIRISILLLISILQFYPYIVVINQ